MKNLQNFSIFTLLLLTFSVHAQWGSNTIKGNGNVVTQTIKTSDYDAVSVGGIYHVTLVAGQEGSITIKGEENLLENTIIEVNNNTLEIKTERNTNLNPSSGKRIEVTVPVKEISAVSLAGSGKIVTQNLDLKSQDMQVSLAGSGDIKLTVQTTDLEAKLAGSGDIELMGKASNLKGSVAGSGDINLEDLITKKADVAVAGSGNIKVHSTEELKARISGSGNIVYKGNPTVRDTKTAGSGKIKSD